MVLSRALVLIVIIGTCICCSSSKLLWMRKVFASALAGSLIPFSIPSIVAATEIKDQIKVIQALQVEKQIDSVKEQKQMMQKSSSSSSSEVIARGIVALPPPSGSGIDVSQYPLGFSKAGMVDSRFDDKKASLIITAVPRNGPPFAAKIIRNLPSKSFPLAFTISSDDLLFPYTKEAWDSSQYSKDSIAITAVLDEDGLLETPEESTRFGFAIAQVTKPMKQRNTPQGETKDEVLNSGVGIGEGVTYATSTRTGKPAVEAQDVPSKDAYARKNDFSSPTSRREAKISISLKAEGGNGGSKYSQEETDLLRSLDKQLSTRS